MAAGIVFPASRTISPISVAARASSKSAARCNTAARSTGGVACQIGAASSAQRKAHVHQRRRGLGHAAHNVARIGGVEDVLAAPSASPSASIGAACQSNSNPASRAAASEPRRCSFVRSSPAEFFRPGSKDRARQGDFRMRAPKRLQAARLSHRVGDQRLDRR